MSNSIYLLTLGLFFGTILLVFGMKYFSAAVAARARIANDTVYQALAEKIAAAQSDQQVLLSAIQAELAKVSASLTGVEKILKQVE